MDQADSAYKYSNECLDKINKFGTELTKKERQAYSDGVQLGIFEAKGVRSLQKPDNWFELYLTESDKWKKKGNYERATLLSGFKEIIELILVSSWKLAINIKDKQGGIKSIGKV